MAFLDEGLLIAMVRLQPFGRCEGQKDPKKGRIATNNPTATAQAFNTIAALIYPSRCNRLPNRLGAFGAGATLMSEEYSISEKKK